MALPSVAEREAFIRAYAKSIGIDPDVAVAVARSEGLADNTWQSKLQQPYGRERSYGDFQLHVAPEGRRPGLGNAFKNETGLDPSDPANWQSMNRFALDQAKRGGWSPWMGAKAIGVTGKAGIGGQASAAPIPAPQVPGAGTSMGGFSDGPHAVAARMPNGGLLEPDENFMQSGNMWNGYHDRWSALGDMAMEFAKQNATAEGASIPPPIPPLQPLRRITLGKGLLG